MALVRWQPTGRGVSRGRNRRDDVETFFDDLLGHHPSRRSGFTRRGFTPRLNLKDTPEAFVLSIEIPGFEKEQVELTINSDVITIKGSRNDADEEQVENECYYCRESYQDSFERSVQLPQSIVSDKAEAKLHNGILTVTLPKEQPRKAVTIAVN